ncbi:MAG: hypothetical protein KY443_09960 [Actinobacteria bacterium]|nr:hypothetical protein [Actinomycetota bacterium]
MPRRQAGDDDQQAGDIDVDAAVDALYVDDPDRFTAARDELARRLRAAGRRQDAVAVRKLRRPTMAAWAVNRVARQRAADVARLRSTGADLRCAQEDVLSGGADGRRADADRLRELGARRRDETAELVEAAVAALGEREVSPDPHRDDIVATFDAVVADQSAADAVRAARLTRALEAPVGLGAPDAEIVALAGGGTPTPRKPKRSATGATSNGTPTAASTATGRLHVLDAAEVRKARARAAKAQEAAEAAAREVARLEAALAAARREAARTTEAAARADAATRAAEAAATRSTG